MTASVRTARASDTADIVRLTQHLGYEVDAGSLRERLPRLLARPDQQVLIAERDGAAVGWLHASVWEFYEHVGYQKLKMQYSFAKPVDPARGDLRQFVPRLDE